ncbi:MAG TPA: hypothetical protein VK737_08070 [Opitutales bacterium]|nr:hypothetical protein [Opitutales bacterium]
MACALAGAWLRAADAAPSGQKYQPQIAPQFTAGQIFSYKAEVTYDSLFRTTKYNRRPQTTGPDLRTETSEIAHDDFSAELTVETALARDVFKNGSLREAEFLVTRCELSDGNGNLRELIPAGAIIGARKQADGQVAYAINGYAPDALLAARLSVLIPMGDSHSTANELLGPPAQVPVRAVWQLNAKAMLNSDLLSLFPGVSAVSGGVVFVKIGTEPGPPRGTINAEYNLMGAKSPFPAGIVAAPSLVSFNVQATAPLTPGPGKYDFVQKVSVRHQGQTGNADAGYSETDVDFAVLVNQNIHYTIDSGRPTPVALVHAPAEPDAPPLPPNISSAPILRPLPIPKKITVQNGGNPAAPGSTTSPAPAKASMPAPLPPLPTPAPAPAAPTEPPPPLYTPDLKSLNPLNNSQGLPEQPAPASTTH